MKKKIKVETPQRRQCFQCNGTGEMCNVCGESSDVCECEEGCSVNPCNNCGGVGIAILDQTDKEKAEGKKYRDK